MNTSRIAELIVEIGEAKAKVSELEHTLQKLRNQELRQIHLKYGYSTVGEFIYEVLNLSRRRGPIPKVKGIAPNGAR